MVTGAPSRFLADQVSWAPFPRRLHSKRRAAVRSAPGRFSAIVHPYLDHPGPLAIAHRGGASDAPENTLAAFQHAVDLGFRYVETDVHLTADGQLIAFHDDRLDRVTDRTGAIANLTWDEVRQARVDGREPIPLLRELLDTWPHLRINIDPKSDAAVPALIEELRRPGVLERVCVGAFSDARLDVLCRELGDGLCSSMGPRAVARVRAGRRPGGPAQCLQVPPRHRGIPIVTSKLLDRVHDWGLQVHVWTIDAEHDMAALLDLGVDGVMTDRPAALRSVLEERGQWMEPT